MKPNECKSFNVCSAPLCPLDEDIAKRFWVVGEEMCIATGLRAKRWIRKQRSITKRQNKSYLNRPVSYQELFDASRPRKPLTDEQRLEMVQRLEKFRWKNENSYPVAQSPEVIGQNE